MKKFILLISVLLISKLTFSQVEDIELYQTFNKDTIYLYNENEFRYALFHYSNEISQPPELYLQYIMSVKGKYRVKKDSIIFSCDSLYGLNCCYSVNNKNDETLFKYLRVYIEDFPFIPNLYFCKNNDTIAKIVNRSKGVLKFNDSIIINKNKHINNIIMDWTFESKNINITNLSDTIFIFEKNRYYDIFNNKKFKLHSEERLNYILVDNIRVYITFREPPKEVIDKDRYSKLFEVYGEK